MDSVIDLRLGRDLRQSPEFGRFMKTIGWEVIQIPRNILQNTNNTQYINHNSLIFIKKIGPIRVAKMRRPGPNTDYDEVIKRLSGQGVFIFQMDPEVDNPEMFKKLGFRKNGDQILGTKTLLIDLRPEINKVMDSFKPETRNKLRKFLISNDKLLKNNFDLFYKILREGYKDLDVWCPPIDQYNNLINAFAEKCFCLTINDVSGCLVIINQGVAEYYYAASTKAGKENNLPYLVVWEAMKEAKKRGAVVWDFNGFYDDRYPDKRWKGFSFFKSRFGGTTLEFAGSYSKINLPWNK